MEFKSISMYQIVARLRNRGYVGDRPRYGLRLEGTDDNEGRSCDLWLSVQRRRSNFPENSSLTTAWQGVVFSHRRQIPAGSLRLYACNYCRNSFGWVSMDGWFSAAIFTPREQEVHTLADLLHIMRLTEKDHQSQYLLEALGF